MSRTDPRTDLSCNKPSATEPVGTMRYRHQAYHSAPPTSSYQLLQPLPQVVPAPKALRQQLREELLEPGRLIGNANVVAIFLNHGTFAGGDPLGIWSEVARVAPSVARPMERCCKRLFDAIAGEMGNYTSQYASALEEGVCQGAGKKIAVQRFHWSGQNSHIGRADAAVRLIDRLARLADGLDSVCWEGKLPPRVLLWGHSHSGNIFALASHLIAQMRTSQSNGSSYSEECSFLESFFHAASCFYRRTFSTRIDLSHWPRVQQILSDATHSLRRLAIDMVTFGTPIRYGWDPRGVDHLLHFVHHHPQPGQVDYLGPSSIRPWRILAAADGDAVNQFGIAGTNMLFNPFAWRTVAADCRLHRLLQHNLPRESFLRRGLRGRRVPDVGTTLLVDYPMQQSNIIGRLLGHAVYTRSQWLPLHLNEVARRFFS